MAQVETYHSSHGHCFVKKAFAITIALKYVEITIFGHITIYGPGYTTNQTSVQLVDTFSLAHQTVPDKELASFLQFPEQILQTKSMSE